MWIRVRALMMSRQLTTFIFTRFKLPPLLKAIITSLTYTEHDVPFLGVAVIHYHFLLYINFKCYILVSLFSKMVEGVLESAHLKSDSWAK